MDDLIAQIIARLARDAADIDAELGSGPVEFLTQKGALLNGESIGLRRALNLVKDMWAEEQASIAEEERNDLAGPGYATDEADMHWHTDSQGEPCACIEEEHDAGPRILSPEGAAR